MNKKQSDPEEFLAKKILQTLEFAGFSSGEIMAFALIPRDAASALMAISDQIRRRLQRMYRNITRDFPDFRILTLNEVLEDYNRLEGDDIMLTLKLLYRQNPELFQYIPPS